MRERKGESERDKRRGKPRKFEREREIYINITFQKLGKKPGILRHTSTQKMSIVVMSASKCYGVGIFYGVKRTCGAVL